MTGKQLQALIDRAGFSQRGTAKLIGIGERTMRGYISGEHPIPLTVEYAVRWVTQAKTP
jgi:predicted transcriptional regulator